MHMLQMIRHVFSNMLGACTIELMGQFLSDLLSTCTRGLCEGYGI